MKRVAIITTGGDAPGINAAIRAAVRTGIDVGWEMFGIRHGYSGLVNDNFIPLGPRDVGGIIEHAGTMLGSKRYPEFKAHEAQATGLRILREREIDALIVIGGDGSQAGALALSEKGFPVIGIASTIDNDLYGSEMSIGVDTAVNIALEAVDRLRVTASSHERAFLVEVMGRDCGYLALVAGIAGGAESIVVPEIVTDPEVVASDLRAAYERGKSHAVVVVSEGAKYNAESLSIYFEEHRERLGFELRTTKLGHVQRGGAPGAFDRLLATRFGAAAIHRLAQGEHGDLVGLVRGDLAFTPLKEIAGKRKKLDCQLFDLARVLAK